MQNSTVGLKPCMTTTLMKTSTLRHFSGRCSKSLCKYSVGLDTNFTAETFSLWFIVQYYTQEAGRV